MTEKAPTDEKYLFQLLSDCALEAGSQQAFAERLGMTAPLLLAWLRGLDDSHPSFALRIRALRMQRPRSKIGEVAKVPSRGPAMTAEELRKQEFRVGGRKEVARGLGVSYGTVYSWMKGERPIPEVYGECIRSLPTAMTLEELVEHVQRLGNIPGTHRATGISCATIRSLLLEQQPIRRNYADRLRGALPRPSLDGIRGERKQSAMSVDDFRDLVTRYGGIRLAARALGIGHSTVHRYFAGKARIPTPVADALRALLKVRDLPSGEIDLR